MKGSPLVVLDPEEEGTVILGNVSSDWSIDTASYPSTVDLV